MNNVFELRKDQLGPNPVVEILKDGEPFWEDIPGAKAHFSFGVEKARIILAAIDHIRKFFDSNGDLPGPGNPFSLDSDEWKVRNCVIRYHDGFNQYGKWVDRPFLELSGEKKSIGLGLLKAQAILELEGELKNFMVPYK